MRVPALTDAQLRALARLRELSAAEKCVSLPPLLEWIPQVSRDYASPRWLSPIAMRIEQILSEPVEFCFSVPPRHGKTTLVWHAVAWLMLQRPWMRVLFAASEQRRAEREMARAKALFIRAGGTIGNVDRADVWETSGGGYVRSAGLNGPIIGDGFHVVFVDDPHRGRLEAESKTVREAVVTRFMDDVYTRREPARGDFKGTSFVIVHTRWHCSDLIGVVSQRADGWRPFQYVNLPYEDAAGNVLAPELWPAETVANYRRNQRNWTSVFLGRPQPAGGSVFEGSHLYELHEMPSGCRYAIGVDLAYSSKASADFSVAVVLARGSDERTYVVDVVREQCRPRDFATHLLRLQNEYPGAPLRWYASGTESGVADLLRDIGVTRLLALAAKHEKKVRALPVSDAWNEGRVLLPRGAPGKPTPEWVSDFADEVLSFTGAGDAHDDQVDALAAAFDALDSGTGLVAPITNFNRPNPMGGPRSSGRKPGLW